MKWSLFNWKKPVVSSGEPEDYQVVKNTVTQNERNITNINTQVNNINTQVGNINNQLTNTVSTNTTQTITGEKTFSNGIVSTKTGETIQVKPGENSSGYISFYNGNTRVAYMGKASSNSNNLTLGGTAKIVLEPIGGVEVPTPTANNNPATKNYVDNKETTINNNISNINNQINTINTNINELNEFKNNATGIGLNLRYQDLTVSSYSHETADGFRKIWFSISTLQETKFLSAVIHYKGQTYSASMSTNWIFSYATTWGPRIYFNLWKPAGNITRDPDWNNTFIRIFYIDTLNTRTDNPYFIEEVNNEN